MTEDRQQEKSPEARARERRETRLAAALRQNLRRRKEAARNAAGPPLEKREPAEKRR